MVKSLNDIKVSFFENVLDVTPKQIPLLRWLSGSDRYNPLVTQIRATGDKEKRNELKKQLPAITPSGIFRRRGAAFLVKHSGFISLDFDNLQNPAETKAKISQIANVFYCGLSVSGAGLWALVPISNPEHHKQHFDALRIDFLRLGLIIDRACSDVSRLRFYSYDAEPYINFDAVTYSKTYSPPPPEYWPQTFTPAGASNPLQIACKMITDSTPGEMHHNLLKAAHLAGGYIATGEISEPEAVQKLETAIQNKPIKSFAAAQKTIKKGIEHGKTNPITK